MSFYHSVELILKRAKAQNFPVLIKSRDPGKDPHVFPCKQLFVVQEGKKKTFVPTINCTNQPVMVIEGISHEQVSRAIQREPLRKIELCRVRWSI